MNFVPVPAAPRESSEVEAAELALVALLSPEALLKERVLLEVLFKPAVSAIGSAR